jgi:hypothetical protein
MSYNKDQERLNTERYDVAQENARREDTAALSGATLGILVALAIAAAAGTFFFFNSRETAPTAPAVSPSAAPSAAPEKQTIIREEKVRELVPVPQTTTQPNININVPSAAPAAPSSGTAPAAQSPAAAPSASKNTSPSSMQSPAQAESSSPSPTN